MDRSEEHSPKKEPVGREQHLATREAPAFEKERAEKEDGRYIIYYDFGEDAGGAGS